MTDPIYAYFLDKLIAAEMKLKSVQEGHEKTHKEDVAMYNEMCDRLAQLAKENKELKDQIRTLESDLVNVLHADKKHKKQDEMHGSLCVCDICFMAKNSDGKTVADHLKTQMVEMSR